MTIIVFLIDTSASMNQRTCLGGRPTLLDVAKGAIETFVKVRQRSPDSKGDRYMLLTLEEPPSNIKAGWKENLSTFMTELKNLNAVCMTTIGSALKSAFDILNLNRMQTGIDTYGQGRCPYYLEPAVVVIITDGGKLSSSASVQDEINLPMHAIVGSELTREPFRWDQRLFSLVLRLSGTPANDSDPGLVPSDQSPIDAMCEVTGGRSYCITSHRMLLQCVDSLVQKVQSGVVIHFEKVGPDPPLSEAKPDAGDPDDVVEVSGILNGILQQQSRPATPNPINSVQAQSTAWYSCRRMIYVPRSAQKGGYAVGFWPIPESFWPDVNMPQLPPRTAHPSVKFLCTNQEPLVVENFPFDKYELEPSPLTQYILSRKQSNVCWQVFVANSSRNSDIGHPFGYLKASSNLSSVNLFVMPYNYPVLLPLLDELFKVHHSRPTNDWKQQFNNYLRMAPTYYATPLRRALSRMGAAPLANNLIPESLDNNLSYSVINHFKRIKNQAKVEFDKLCSEVGLKPGRVGLNSLPDGIRLIAKQPIRRDVILQSSIQEKYPYIRDHLVDYSGFIVGLKDRMGQPQRFRNPFDISRHSLIDQLTRMKANFFQPSSTSLRFQDEDHVHCLPVGQMGNYQDYLKRIPQPLREIESQPVRQHMFGNPFKIDKGMKADEVVDIDLVVGVKAAKRQANSDTNTNSNNNDTSSNGAIQRSLYKRKRGPLPKEFTIKQARRGSPVPMSPSEIAPPSTPLPEPMDESSQESIEYPTVQTTTEWTTDKENTGFGGFYLSGPPSPPPEPTRVFYSENEWISDVIATHAELPPLPPSPPPPLPPPDDDPATLALIRHRLRSVRINALKLVRKPGKNYTALFECLSELRGCSVSAQKVMDDVIRDALRFKRKELASKLEEFSNRMQALSSS